MPQVWLNPSSREELKRFVRSAFLRAGFDASRAGIRRRPNDTRTSGRIVELIGGAGVGKTTTLLHARKKFMGAWHWHYPAPTYRDEWKIAPAIDDFCSEILRSAYNGRFGRSRFSELGRFLPWVSNVLLSEREVLKGGFQAGFFLDEGLVKLLDGSVRDRIECGDLDREVARELLASRSLVRISVTAETRYRRLQARARKHPERGGFLIELPFDEFRKIHERAYHGMSKTLDMCCRLGCDISEMDGNEGPESCAFALCAIERVVVDRAS